MSFPLPAAFRQRMQTLLGDESGVFFESYTQPLRRGLRVNTCKCAAERFWELFALPLSPVPFAPDGFWVGGDLRAGADPLHHAGAYYMQEPSAMSAVTLLAPRPGERVLDLCAAPGGKSTQIAAALRGQGVLWSNEYVRSRAQILQQNLERCGVTNAVVSSADAQTVCDALDGWFDAVLVDAPCSGEGMFRKEPAALEQWSLDNIRLCAGRQRDILRAAARAVRPGGRLVYSTCTFAPEENECQLALLLAEHPEFELADGGVTFGRPAFSWEQVAAFAPAGTPEPANLSYARRILPQDGGEGHFLALLRHKGDAVCSTAAYAPPRTDESARACAELYAACFCTPPRGHFVTVGGTVRLLPEGLPPLNGTGVLTAGVAVGEICKNRVEPCHSVFMAAMPDDCRSVCRLEQDDARVTAFLRGEEIAVPEECRGWTAVAVADVVTGFGKASGGRLKNRYPKGLRLRG